MILTKTLIVDEKLVELALKLFIGIFPDEEMPVGLSGLYVENADKEFA